MFSSNRLFHLLDARGITAYRLAKEAGFTTSQVTVWKKERSKPSIDALISIADYLDVSIDYLSGRTDKPEVNR